MQFQKETFFENNPNSPFTIELEQTSVFEHIRTPKKSFTQTQPIKLLYLISRVFWLNDFSEQKFWDSNHVFNLLIILANIE